MDQSSMHLLEFEPRFEQQVQALILTVYQEFGYGPYLDADLLAIAPTYAGRSRLWVAADGDQVVGTGAIRERSPVMAEVKRIYVGSLPGDTDALVRAGRPSSCKLLIVIPAPLSPRTSWPPQKRWVRRPFVPHGTASFIRQMRS